MIFPLLFHNFSNPVADRIVQFGGPDSTHGPPVENHWCRTTEEDSVCLTVYSYPVIILDQPHILVGCTFRADRKRGSRFLVLAPRTTVVPWLEPPGQSADLEVG